MCRDPLVGYNCCILASLGHCFPYAHLHFLLPSLYSERLISPHRQGNGCDDVGGCCPCRNQNFLFGKLELTTACSTSHTYIAIFPDIHIAQVIPHIAGHHFFQIVICPSVREICVNISSPQLVVGIHASGSGLVSRR